MPRPWRRAPRRPVASKFAGTRWNQVNSATDAAFTLNTYRVLLTRARYATIIWVPPGDSSLGDDADRTRPTAEMDAIAAFLLGCGARPLEATQPAPFQAQAALLQPARVTGPNSCTAIHRNTALLPVGMQGLIAARVVVALPGGAGGPRNHMDAAALLVLPQVGLG
jgi:hypothetical protein